VKKQLLFIFLLALCSSLEAVIQPQANQELSGGPKARDQNVRQVIQDFIQTLRKGAAAKAYQSYTTPSFREQTSLDQFYEFVARYASLNRNKTFEILSITYHENIASVTVQVSSLERKDNLVSFAVAYVEGHWRILGITVHPSATSS
jgi:hypothetical protein